MFGLRMPELLLILLIVIVLFGATKLPQLGAGLGEGLRSFKKSFKDDDAKDAQSSLPEHPPASQATVQKANQPAAKS
jgi:sec-independent protein translocase protein TatA